MVTKKSTKKYLETVGRRKTAVARVRIVEADKTTYVVNNVKLFEYFPVNELQEIIKDPLKKSKIDTKFSVSGLVKGGGITAQAEAFRHGISRALLLFDKESKKSLKKFGFLKRDPRMKERKKFGLKKARKAPQWSKR